MMILGQNLHCSRVLGACRTEDVLVTSSYADGTSCSTGLCPSNRLGGACRVAGLRPFQAPSSYAGELGT